VAAVASDGKSAADAPAKTEVIWSRRAIADVASIERYVARHNPDAAARLVDRILSSVKVLTEFPLIGREGRAPNSRELVIADTSYIVAYRIHDERGIEILTVRHGARLWPAQL
jgi:toxin ParE1/3/4